MIGRVTIGAEASVWFNAVLRADHNTISIGARTNIQDGTVVHCDPPDFPGPPVEIGAGVTIGHGARLHGCAIEDDCLVGSGAIILDGARIGARSLVAAGALVPSGAQVPAGSLVVGSPASVKRPVNERELSLIATAAGMYVDLARSYRDDG